MIKQYALTALQKAIHHALKLDETISGKLVVLNGRVLKIIITPLNVGFYIQFSDGEMIFLDEYTGAVDTTIQSSPLGFIRLSLLPSSKVRSLFNDNIRISGDIELGQHVKQIFDGMDIDWEGHLAHFTGDAIAYQLGSFVRKGRAIKQQFDQSMQQNMTGFLQEEYRALPSREEVSDFFDDVDALSLDVERLSAHIRLLLNATKTHHEIH